MDTINAFENITSPGFGAATCASFAAWAWSDPYPPVFAAGVVAGVFVALLATWLSGRMVRE